MGGRVRARGTDWRPAPPQNHTPDDGQGDRRIAFCELGLNADCHTPTRWRRASDGKAICGPCLHEFQIDESVEPIPGAWEWGPLPRRDWRDAEHRAWELERLADGQLAQASMADPGIRERGVHAAAERWQKAREYRDAPAPPADTLGARLRHLARAAEVCSRDVMRGQLRRVLELHDAGELTEEHWDELRRIAEEREP